MHPENATTARPPLSRRRLLAGIAAGAATALVAACGGPTAPTAPAVTATVGGSAVAGGRLILATLVAATPEPATATMPPRPTTAPPAASATPRPAGTSTINAVTATPRPNATVITGTAPVRGTNAPAPSAGPAGTLATYTDPDGSIRLQYPANWRAQLPMSATDSDLRLETPGMMLFSLTIVPSEGGMPLPSVDEFAQLIQDSQMRSQQYVYTTTPLQDATVGGERGKSFEYTFVERANRTLTPRRGVYWIIPRGDRMYVFQASNVETSRGEADMVLGSVMFMDARPAASRAPLPATRTTGAPSPTPRPAGTASAVRG